MCLSEPLRIDSHGRSRDLHRICRFRLCGCATDWLRGAPAVSQHKKWSKASRIPLTRVLTSNKKRYRLAARLLSNRPEKAVCRFKFLLGASFRRLVETWTSAPDFDFDVGPALCLGLPRPCCSWHQFVLVLDGQSVPGPLSRKLPRACRGHSARDEFKLNGAGWLNRKFAVSRATIVT